MKPVLDSTAPAERSYDRPYRLERCAPEEAAALAESVEACRDGSEEGRRAASAALGVAELDFALGLKTPKRLRDWLAGRLAAKRLVNWCLAQDGRYLRPPQVQILSLPDGSPAVRTPAGDETKNFPISISHSASGGIAAVVAAGHRVGVDLERIEPRSPQFLSVMAHDSEWSDAMGFDPAEQTRLWTLKEAVSKLLGTGLSAGFHDLRFPLDGDARRLRLFGQALSAWETLGRPVIEFDSIHEGDDILSIAYA